MSNQLKIFVLLVAIILVGPIFSVDNALAEYDYPINNPLAATVIGTPVAFKAQLDEDIDVVEATLPAISDRKTPEAFWYNEELKYSYALQDNEAPLLFIIAGTGAQHSSHKMKVLQRKFFSEGYHVVNVTSPTHPNFLVSASTYQLPGNLWTDAIDIYEVFKRIIGKIRSSAVITDYYVTGYSLGGAHAAFVTYLDETQQHFKFKKALLINPPYSLFNSIRILDAMWDGSEYFGHGGAAKLSEKIFIELAQRFETTDFTEFNEDFLFSIYKDKQPPNSDLEALIGLSFRLSSSGMIFAADVMRNEGIIYPKDKELNVSDSTSQYLQKLSQYSFEDYVRQMFFPFYSTLSGKLTFDQLVGASSLAYLESYLKGNKKFALVTNADDVILAPGDLDQLKSLFAGRSWIFPNGGHCGNLEHRDFLNSLVDALKFELEEG